MRKLSDGWFRNNGHPSPVLSEAWLHKNARLSLGGDNRLLLVVEDGLASDYFTKEPANKGALEQLLAELTGKQIEVEVRSVRSKQEMESSYVDLTRVIHMDIEEE